MESVDDQGTTDTGKPLEAHTSDDKPIEILEGAGNVPSDAKPIEQSQAIEVSAKVIVPKKNKDALSIRDKSFINNLVIGKMNQTDAYLNAGYKCTRDTAGSKASLLAGKDSIRKGIAELQNSLTLDTKREIDNLFPKAIDKLGVLIDSNKDYASLGAIKEVLKRTNPVVTRNESIKVVVNQKELDRRRALLDKYKLPQ